MNRAPEDLNGKALHDHFRIHSYSCSPPGPIHCVSVCIAVYYTGHHTFIVHASDFRWQNCVPNKIKAFLIQIEREPLLNESTDKGTLIRLCKHHFESYCK